MCETDRSAALGSQAVSNSYHNASECEIGVRLSRSGNIIVFVNMNATDPDAIKMGMYTFTPNDVQSLSFFELALNNAINYHRSFNDSAAKNASDMGMTISIYDKSRRELKVTSESGLIRFTIVPMAGSKFGEVFFDFQRDEAELLQRFKVDFTRLISDRGTKLPPTHLEKREIH